MEDFLKQQQEIIRKQQIQIEALLNNQQKEKLDSDNHEYLVKSITSFLPKVDGVGGFVLHMNDVFINYILHVDVLSPNIKKSLILLIINISQMGDAAGHTILQYYYDLVDCLL